ncbi:MAG TPA: amidohydrolase [Actinobacteria bacterium]|nr:amidohydrolase [Actinomycetota bacterium]
MADRQPVPWRRIATEEAFLIPEVHDALRSWAAGADPDEPDQDFWGFVLTQDLPGLQRVRRQLLDTDDERLAIMDEHGVSVHLLSLTAPGVQTFGDAQAVELAALVNDRLAAIIARHPDRFAGLAAIAPQVPHAAAAEIERAMKTLRLNGVVINSHTRNEYLDEEKFWPIFEAAQALRVPIYIHPRSPSAQMAAPYRKYGLETGMYGFQAETGLHAIRLICSGVFDRFPDLKIVLGHLGEGIPFWLYRVDYMHPVRSSRNSRPKLQLTPGEYFKRNFAITTSGMNWHPALRFCIEAVGADNIMFAIDYPYQLTVGAVQFMDSAPIPDQDKHKIFHLNAERIFGIPAGAGIAAGTGTRPATG